MEKVEDAAESKGGKKDLNHVAIKFIIETCLDAVCAYDGLKAHTHIRKTS